LLHADFAGVDRDVIIVVVGMHVGKLLDVRAI
jgi:hypothetical protein